MKKIFKNIVIFILCFCFMFPISGNVVTVYAEESKDVLTEKRNDLLDQIAKLNEIIASVTTEKNQKEKEKNQIVNQIQLKNNQLKVLNNKIYYLKSEIEEKETKINELTEEIAKNEELFMKRIRSLYMTNKNTNILSIALGSKSFGEYISNGEYMKCVAEHDKALMEQISADREEQKEIQKELEEQKTELVSSQNELSSQKQVLVVEKDKVVDSISEISAQQKEYEKEKAETEKQLKAVRDEMNKIYASLGGSGVIGDYEQTGFIVPVNKYYISCYYGWRKISGVNDFHTGLDFASPCNTEIHAAAFGKVVYVRTGAPNNTRAWGYGNYVIVDHGNGCTTLYGHCNSVNVSVGDYVEQGQTIARVGTTGWSTGYHLHFEIRFNGSYTDPLKYLNIN